MLAVEIGTDGGVLIQGTERDLRTLASWLLKVAVVGHARPAFLSDRALTSVTIKCKEEE